MYQGRMRIRALSIFSIWILVCASFVGMLLFADEVEGATIIVPVDYPTIQDAINNAIPGDTIYVWAGTYHENVVVNKTVTLIGNGTATTIIDGDYSGDAIYIDADWVNISGITIKRGNQGIYAGWRSNIMIDDCDIQSNNGYGIYLSGAYNTTINNTDIFSNTDNGIYLDWADYNTIKGCDITSNGWAGIHLSWSSNTQIIGCNVSGHGGPGINVWEAQSTTIKNTNIWNNNEGITIDTSPNTVVEDCDIYSNNWRDVYLSGNDYTIRGCNITSNNNEGIYLSWVSNSEIISTNISNHSYGISAWNTFNTMVTNSSISNSSSYDLYLASDSHLTLLNTTFNESNVYYDDFASDLTVEWYLHVFVQDTLGNPIAGGNVSVNDTYGTNIYTGITDAAGYARWIVCNEYTENQTGHIFDYTPHNVTANATDYQTGYAVPEPPMDISKIVVVVLLHANPVQNIDTGEDFPTIQAAIDDPDTQNGHTLFLKIFTYNEDIIVNKSLNLIGQNKNGVVVVGSGPTGVVIQIDVPGVAIGNLTAKNGNLMVNNTGSVTFTNTTIHCYDLIVLGQFHMVDCPDTLVTDGDNLILGVETLLNTTFTSNGNITVGNGGFFNVTNSTILMNCSFNGEYWIQVNNTGEMNIRDYDGSRWTANDRSEIASNTQWRYMFTINAGANFMFRNSELTKCGWDSNNRGLAIETDNAIIDGTLFSGNYYALCFNSSTPPKVTNCTIDNSNTNSAFLDSNSLITFLNTTFDKNKVNYGDALSTFTVQWYLHIRVLSAPSLPAPVEIKNITGQLEFSGSTDAAGELNWVVLSESMENQALRIIYTPHLVSAKSGGYIGHESVTLDASKHITIYTTLWPPSVNVELVTGLQYSNANVEYDVIASVTVNGEPRSHTTDATLLVNVYDDDMNKVVDNETMNVLDAGMGLYNYNNFATGSGVYFVIVYCNTSGSYSIGMTSFEVVDWIQDILNINATVKDIQSNLSGMNLTDLLAAIDYLNQTLPDKIDDLASNLTGVNDSLMGIVSDAEINILNELSKVNASLYAEIQDLLANITDDIADMMNSLALLEANLSAQHTVITDAIDTLNNTIADAPGLSTSDIMDRINDSIVLIQSLDGNMTAHDVAIQNLLSALNDLVQNENNLTRDQLIDNVTEILNQLQIVDQDILNEIAVLNTTMSDQLTSLLENMTTDSDALRDWLEIVLGLIDANLTAANATLQQQLADLDAAMDAYYNDIIADLNDVFNSLALLEANLSAQHDVIDDAISDLNDTIAGAPGLSTGEILDRINDSIALIESLDTNMTTHDSQIQTILNSLNNLIQNQHDMTRTQLLENLTDVLDDLQDLDADIISHDDDVKENMTTLQDLINNLGVLDISEISDRLSSLELNLTAHDDAIAQDVADVEQQVADFQDFVDTQLAGINDTLDDLEKLDSILADLLDLDQDLQAAEANLEQKIDEIPTEKKEGEEAFGITEMLLIVVLVLLLINLLIMLMGSKRGYVSEAVPDEDKIVQKPRPVEKEEAWEEPVKEESVEEEDIGEALIFKEPTLDEIEEKMLLGEITEEEYKELLRKYETK